MRPDPSLEPTSFRDSGGDLLAEPVGGGDVADAAEIAISAVLRDLRDGSFFNEIIATHRPTD